MQILKKLYIIVYLIKWLWIDIIKNKAKNKLNQNNNNKIIKNQIFEILDKIIIDNSKIEKKKHFGEMKKIKKAIEIMPQLLLIK